MFFKKSNSEPNLPQQKEEFVKDESGFVKIMDYVRSLSGVDLGPKKEITMQRLSTFAKNSGLNSFDMLLSRIKTDSNLRQDILNLLTVNETYFYRELAQLKDVISYAKSLANARILCAPCSSGDEVYSIAMLAYEASMPNSLVNILGIDINSQAISQAISGEYSARSLHRLSDEQRSKFFKASGDKFLINKSILPKCEFKIVNIFDDAIFNLGKFDIILSRNMMIYFDDSFRLKCVERLGRMLDSGGRLYAGHADLVPYTPVFEKRFISGSSFYEKV